MLTFPSVAPREAAPPPTPSPLQAYLKQLDHVMTLSPEQGTPSLDGLDMESDANSIIDMGLCVRTFEKGDVEGTYVFVSGWH